MNTGKKSLIATSIISYGVPGIYSCIYGNDQIYGYYCLFLAFFSGLYHYHDELNYFAEDFICSFFIKYHIFLNYIWWLTWSDFLKYFFLMDIFGHLIFYYSVKTWEKKCISHDYYWVHNIWHLFTGGLAFYVVLNEKFIEMYNWNIFYMLCFVFIMTRYNLKKCIFQKHLILSTFYLWNLSNFYNITSILFYYILQRFFNL